MIEIQLVSTMSLPMGAGRDPPSKAKQAKEAAPKAGPSPSAKPLSDRLTQLKSSDGKPSFSSPLHWMVVTGECFVC